MTWLDKEEYALLRQKLSQLEDEVRSLKGRPNESRIVKGLRNGLGTMVKRVQELEELVISWKRIAEREREDKKALLEMMRKA